MLARPSVRRIARAGALADLILIPKQLRMEWTDLLAHDRELSNSGFRVACVIGSHFNRRTGDTYVKQETIAEKLGMSERTVWTAIMELERLGYLIIARRELGVRATDGRRVCGGRGVANTYLPAFERSQVTATFSGQKLAARCDHLWSERSQSSVTKVAAHCDPTLTSSSKKNLTRARAGNAEHVEATASGLSNERRLQHPVMPGTPAFDAWLAWGEEISASKMIQHLNDCRSRGVPAMMGSPLPPVARRSREASR